MTALRIVRLETLQARLRDVLGDDSLLLHRLDRALAVRDAAALDEALAVLEHYPPAVRQAVRNAVAAWLFGDAAVPASVGDAAFDAPGSQERAPD